MLSYADQMCHGSCRRPRDHGSVFRTYGILTLLLDVLVAEGRVGRYDDKCGTKRLQRSALPRVYIDRRYDQVFSLPCAFGDQ